MVHMAHAYARRTPGVSGCTYKSGGAEESRSTTGKEVEMENAAKEVAPEIMVSTEEIAAEVKEEVKEAPSRLRAVLRAA